MTHAVHAPALSLPEAAMLPALSREAAQPCNLILPDRRTYYHMPQSGQTVDPPRRGSMAGRAVLKAVVFPKEKGRIR